jgi:hypothetical protein
MPQERLLRILRPGAPAVKPTSMVGEHDDAVNVPLIFPFAVKHPLQAISVPLSHRPRRWRRSGTR